MYKWTIGESIDAWKLNVMQNRRIMATLNEDGKPVVVTLSDVSPTDDGTWFKIPTDVLEQKPGSFGHVQLDYDNDCNRYKLATASPNITGFMENVRPEANTHKWTTKLEKDWVKDTSHHTMSMAEYMQCFNAWDAGSSLEPPPVWEWYPDKQKTDPDPTVLNENCVRLFATTLRQRKDEGSGYDECFLMLDMEGWKAENTRMFTPDSYDLGSITADPGTDGFYKKLHATVKNKKIGEEHVFEIANHDNIEIWPLARPKGMSKEEFKDLGTKAEGGNVQDGPAGTVPGQEGQTSDKGSAIDDFKNRLGKSHWSPLASRDVREGPLIPIMSIGEGGGTFVQHIKDNGTDTYSIAVGSGIEFYDNLTCAERNKKDPRPQSTKATTYLGHGASVTISNINKDKPWQFKLSSTPISITCDLGTTANAVPAYDLPDESYLTWGVVPDYGSESLRTGLMTGKVRRLTDGLICEGDSGEWHQCKQYAVGEIRDGVLGIRTATWRDPMCADLKTATNFAWNRQGGVVVGIVQDHGSCHYKPYITSDGMIHVAAGSGSCENNKNIKSTMSNNFWDVMGDKMEAGVPSCLIASGTSEEMTDKQGQQLNDYHWGQFGLSYNPLDVQSLYSNTTPVGFVRPQMASVVPRTTTKLTLSGTAGEIKEGVIGLPIARWDPVASNIGNGTEGNPYQAEWNPHGGLIRGILADIPLKKAMGGDIIPPFIDSWGFIHIYAPLIPCDMPVERFNSTDCYIHYTCLYDLCGKVHYHDLWNR